MTDAEMLYLALVVLYLLECLVWTGPHAVAFRSPAFGAWRIVFPCSVASRTRGHVMLAHPLPPLGRILLCNAGADAEKVLSADGNEITCRIDAFKRSTRALLVACNLLFVMTFAGGALLVWMAPFRPYWPWYAAGYGIVWMTACGLFFRAHRGVFPSATAERRELLLVMLLSPLSAIRAHDAMAKNLLLSAHPLAVAGVLCGRSRFEEYAGTWYREHLYPEARPESLAVIEGILRAHEIDPDRLLAAPEPAGHCRTWCPRCLSQYALPAGAYADCGTALKEFCSELS